MSHSSTAPRCITRLGIVAVAAVITCTSACIDGSTAEPEQPNERESSANAADEPAEPADIELDDHKFAIEVPEQTIRTVAPGIEPGSRVDLYASFSVDEIRQLDTEAGWIDAIGEVDDDSVTIAVLQNVVTVDVVVVDEEATRLEARSITVSATKEETQMLAVIQPIARFDVVRRSVEPSGVQPVYSFSATHAVEDAQHLRGRRPGLMHREEEQPRCGQDHEYNEERELCVPINSPCLGGGW